MATARLTGPLVSCRGYICFDQFIPPSLGVEGFLKFAKFQIRILGCEGATLRQVNPTHKKHARIFKTKTTRTSYQDKLNPTLNQQVPGSSPGRRTK
jgi:hypothetical protein